MTGARHAPLIEGGIYANRGGGSFRCLTAWSDGGTVRNMASGWTCDAHGITMYEDGSIEWDYSTGGHFS